MSFPMIISVILSTPPSTLTRVSLKDQYDVISAVGDFFDPWDPSTATDESSVWNARGAMMENKLRLITCHESVLVSL